jgi:predicted transcriptional regulator of viral defense system
MNYQYVIKNKQFMEYLGFCNLKGFLYSEYMGRGEYRIIALNNGEASILIRFTGVGKEQDVYV